MYIVNYIDKSTKTIKGSREPVFYVSTDMKYSIYKQDNQLQELVDMIWNNDIKGALDEEWVYWLDGWEEFIFLFWSINIDRQKLYNRLNQWSYSFTLHIKSNKLYEFTTQQQHHATEKLLFSCHEYNITNKEQIYTNKEEVYNLKWLPDAPLESTYIIGPKTVEYKENSNKDCYISYFKFLMLLYPDKLYCIYDKTVDDFIITDAYNLSYAYDEMSNWIIERIDTSIYEGSSDRLNRLRSKYWMSIREKIASKVMWLYDDESISRFEIQKKKEFIQLKITRSGKQAEDINKQLIQYGSKSLKKHWSSKLYEISTMERIDKLDLYNDPSGNLI